MIQQLTVVMYHYVRELPKTRYPGIKGLLVSEFEYQLEYLKKEYNFIRIEDCINAFINNHDLPPNSCLLTFDDGYIDHFENVFPLLKDNNIQFEFVGDNPFGIRHNCLPIFPSMREDDAIKVIEACEYL